MAHGTALTVQPIPATGLSAASYAAAASQMSIPNNNGKMFLHIKNGGVQVTCTIQTPGEVGGLAIMDRTYTIPANTGDVFTSCFAPALYNQSDGMVHVDFSGTASVTVACLTHL